MESLILIPAETDDVVADYPGTLLLRLDTLPDVHIIEHDLIVERTHDGLAAARARGRQGGPEFKMTPNRVRQARAMYDSGAHTVQEIADTFGVSRPTIYRHVSAPGTPPARGQAPASE